jgi:ribose/xylose/arabinose/galactoside ABC-type transport system permease subunit
LPSPNRSWLQQLGLVIVVIAMSIALSIAGQTNRIRPDDPNLFLNKQNLVEDVAAPMSVFAIMAVGLTIVIITGGIDISVGSIMGLSAIMTAWAISKLPLDAGHATVLPIGLGLPILIGVTCGVMNGLLIVTLRIHPFIVTLGTMSIFRGLATVVPPRVNMPVQPDRVPLAMTEQFMKLDLFDVRPMPMLFMIVVAAAGWVYLKYLVVGMQTYAIGGNEEASRLSGLRVSRVKVLCYAISGLCAGIAGSVMVGRFGSASATTGAGYELMVVAAAVIGGASLAGGRGTAIGALLGALVIALIESGISIMKWKQEYRLIIVGSAIIVAVALDRLSEALSGKSRS